jgi:chromosome partitioning protein
MTVSICVTNQKGGVAKTTTAVHLAHGLALRGKRVLLADFDLQGQASTSLRLAPELGIFNLLINRQTHVRETGRDNLFILPGNGTTATAQMLINQARQPISFVSEMFKRFAREYPYVIFDTAPGIGGLLERVIFASDTVIMPTSTEFLSSDGLVKGIQTLHALRAEHGWAGTMLGILPVFFDETTQIARATLAQLREQFPGRILSPIHRATFLRACAAEGKTVFEVNPQHRAAQEYAALVDDIMRRV